MYRVMIVDDEKYIRRSIINRIDWEKYDLEVVGEAADGEEAYTSVALCQPDIVLVDIRMPVLDGLGFIKLLSENYKHIKVIILSAYQDFTYAKKAIHLGVEDYLLKPIDETELEQTLLRMIKELDKKEKITQLPTLDSTHWQKAKFQGKYFLCTSFYLPGIMEEIQQKLAIGYLCDWIKKISFKEFPRLELYLIRNEMPEACICLLWNSNKLKEEKASHLLSQIVEAVKEKHEGIKASISALFQNPEDIEKNRSFSLSLLKYKILKPELLVFHKALIKQEESREFQEGKQMLSVFYNLSMKEEYENMIELLEYFTYNYLQEIHQIWELEYLIDELLVILRALAQKIGNRYEIKVLFHEFKRQDYILGYDNLKFLTGALEENARAILKYRVDSSNKDVTKIIREYIQTHFMENLTTKTISQKFHLNSTYLSTLFKEKSNMTLTAYIEGIRMENARELLKNESFSIADVAESVGYLDTNYFGKVFKKYSGLTPGQYRSSQGNK